MELLGRVNRRKVFYIQIRNNPKWAKSLPNQDWIAFTVANEEDDEMIPSVIKVCLDQNVSCACSAGEFAKMSEEYFDEEITWRAVSYEQETGKDFDYNESPVTTSHRDIGEGFRFACTLAHGDRFDITQIVCIDFTRKKIKKQISELIEIGSQ